MPPTATPPALARFTLAVPDAVIADLKSRLASTRLPTIYPAAAPWHFGTDPTYLRRMLAHWRDHYDWRAAEREINRFPQFTAPIDGKSLHFIHEPGSGPNPPPLLLTHGWPGSIVEFLDIIDPIAHPERHGGNAADGFTVIAPSLPGYGFSEPPDAPINPRQVAAILQRLMVDVLGYRRFFAQGGDWGAIINSWLAFDHPANVAALHVNMIGMQAPDSLKTNPPDAEEQAWLERQAARRLRETAYQQIQGTRPVTLAYGLTDSPAGLAAWILEKFHAWTIPGQDAAPPFDRERLLTNIMLYWLAEPGPASWLYTALFDGTAGRLPPGQRIEVPTGVLLMPNDLVVPPPTRWIQRLYNLVDRQDAPAGGHFAAFEQPDILIAEIRRFFARFRPIPAPPPD